MSKNEEKVKAKEEPKEEEKKTIAKKKFSFATSSAFDSERLDQLEPIQSKTTLLRIRRDLSEFYSSRIPDIHCVPEEDNIGLCHALIQGPLETPYARGFFYFTVRFPADYPIRPPKVRLRTTGSGSVRFNPNLYANGYVCLSILNTWSGPQWSPVLNVTSVLLSIQSLMNEQPYYNEPGREAFRGGANDAHQRSQRSVRLRTDMGQCSAEYNKLIQFETLRVAVLDMIERKHESDVKEMPRALREQMEESFRRNYFFYEQMVEKEVKEKEKQNKKIKISSKEQQLEPLEQTSSSSSSSSSVEQSSAPLFAQIDPSFGDLYDLQKQMMANKTMGEDKEKEKKTNEDKTEVVFVSPLLSSYRRRLSSDHSFDYSLLLKRLRELKAKLGIKEDKEEEEEEEDEKSASNCSIYASIASNYASNCAKSETKSSESLKLEELVSESDFYMEANEEDEEYDLEYESDDSSDEEEKKK